MAVYNNAFAQVSVIGALTSSFQISNGTKQGCPLSPYLYILGIKSLANALRHNASFKGVSIATTEYKLSLFGGDLLLFVSNPKIGLPVILSEFGKYDRVSN